MNSLVHLELHTRDERAASGFYAALLQWRCERVHAGCGSYLALEPGGAVGAGIVECGTPQASWLPYVEVARVEEATECAVRLGAAIVLAPREGPAGWRSIVRTPAGGDLALWQHKGRR